MALGNKESSDGKSPVMSAKGMDVFLAVGRSYDFHEFGSHLGNVG